MDNLCPHHEAMCIKIQLVHEMLQKEIASVDKAIEVAAKQLERRLEGMNEFRVQLEKQASQFASKSEMHNLFDKMETKIEIMQKFQAERAGSLRWSTYFITAIISTLVFVLAHILFKL